MFGRFYSHSKCDRRHIQRISHVKTRIYRDELTGCFGDELVPVSGTDCKDPISKVKVKARLCCDLAHHLFSIIDVKNVQKRI